MEFGNLFFWISLCLMVLLVFFERKDPKTLWAWLLVLTFMPRSRASSVCAGGAELPAEKAVSSERNGG